MRRAEMARRRRNLSEKRNEEVKVRTPFTLSAPPSLAKYISTHVGLPLANSHPQMETINKLLKKQAPKTTRKNAALLAAGDETPDVEPQRPDPMLIRWVHNKNGSRVAVPDELLAGPVGRVFIGGGATGGGGALAGGKMVEEVS
jgi:Ino eighty subunit 2